MAGHSKWAQIKRQKGTADEKRGRLFSKIARMIILAARSGEPNPETNQKLKTAIEKARNADMPKDSIERALLKASSKDHGALEEFFYEAYGPEGSAFLIEGITDSKNRTTQEIKHTLSEYGGKFANPGTVLWLFEKKGILELPPIQPGLGRDELELAAIDSGAESIEESGDTLFVFTEPSTLHAAERTLKEKGIRIEATSLSYVPTSPVTVSETAKRSIQMLMEKLEEYDDVQNVYTNVVF